MSIESFSNALYFPVPSQSKRKNKSKLRREPKSPAVPIVLIEEYKGLACFSPNEPIQKNSNAPGKAWKAADTKDFRVKWKTEICHYWEMHGECKYGDNCAFAHGFKDIRNRKLSMNYKTKQCKQFFEQGYCPYGARCQFSHRRSREFHHVSYMTILSEFLSSDRLDERVLKCPRLKTFKAFGCSNEKTTEENRRQLFGDFIEAKKAATVAEDDEVISFFARGRPLSI